jgi:uncharacterized protein (TIGR01777 family)
MGRAANDPGGDVETERIAVTGSSGLIGSALVDALRADGHTVHRLVRDRSAARGDDLYWSVRDGDIDAAALEGVDGVVHLAGEPLGESRWNDEVKRRIRDSRVDGTLLLSQTLASLSDRPSVLVSGSAVGYYGPRGDEVLTEESGPGDDFMARLCVAWEAAADPARDAGIRVVHSRTGVVMAPEGPLIEKVELPFKLGVGGRIGSGRQWVPWIALEDEVRALRFLLDHDELSGPVNVTAPHPVQNRELTRALGAVMHRPTAIPTPVVAIRALYGEMGVTLATTSQRVVPRVLEEAGFTFRYPHLRPALEGALAG